MFHVFKSSDATPVHIFWCRTPARKIMRSMKAPTEWLRKRNHPCFASLMISDESSMACNTTRGPGASRGMGGSSGRSGRLGKWRWTGDGLAMDRRWIGKSMSSTIAEALLRIRAYGPRRGGTKRLLSGGLYQVCIGVSGALRRWRVDLTARHKCDSCCFATHQRARVKR